MFTSPAIEEDITSRFLSTTTSANCSRRPERRVHIPSKARSASGSTKSPFTAARNS